MPYTNNDLMYALARRLGVLDEEGSEILEQYRPPRYQDPAAQVLTTKDGREIPVINLLGADAEQLVAPRQPEREGDRPGFGLGPEDARKALALMKRDPNELKGVKKMRAEQETEERPAETPTPEAPTPTPAPSEAPVPTPEPEPGNDTTTGLGRRPR